MGPWNVRGRGHSDKTRPLRTQNGVGSISGRSISGRWFAPQIQAALDEALEKLKGEKDLLATKYRGEEVKKLLAVEDERSELLKAIWWTGDQKKTYPLPEKENLASIPETKTISPASPETLGCRLSFKPTVPPATRDRRGLRPQGGASVQGVNRFPKKTNSGGLGLRSSAPLVNGYHGAGIHNHGEGVL